MSDPLNGVVVPVSVPTETAVEQVGELTDVVKDNAGAFDDASAAIEKTSGALDKTSESADAASGSLDKAGTSAKGVADSNDDLAGSADNANSTLQRQVVVSDEVAASLARQAATIKALRDAVESMAITQAEAITTQGEYLKGMQTASIENKVASDAAVDNLGKTYVGFSKLEALGTPAIMKAATWSVLGVGGIAYEGIKQYMEFNKLITQTVTQAGVNPNEMGFLSKTAETISSLTGVNLDDVANSIYRVASGTASWNNGLGSTKKQLFDITKQVSDLQVLGNVAGGATSEQASRVITALINSDIKGIGNNPKLAGQLMNAVIGAGDIRFSDLVPAIGRGLLSSAKANNVSAKDALSWVDVLTSLGTTGSVAGNYVKTGINLLANPSAQGVAALAMLGIKPGEMQGLMSGPGGLQGAVATLIAGMKKFNPGGVALYRNKIGDVYPGGAGTQAAINKLETWAVGELPASFVKLWQEGKLDPKQQAYANDLILTKAFGGSKQFATIAALTNNFSRLTGIESTIGRNDTSARYDADVKRALNTPSQRFHQDLAKMQVDLVKAGQALYPIVIKMTDVFTAFVGTLVRWKPALFELGAAIAAVASIAAAVKVASIGRGAMSFMGGLLEKVNPGGSQGTVLRNIYNKDVSGVTTKLGQESLAAGQTGSIDTELGVLNTTSIENTDRLIAAVETAGGIGRGVNGAVRGVEGNAASGVEIAAMTDAQKATRISDLLSKGTSATAAESAELTSLTSGGATAVEGAASEYLGSGLMGGAGVALEDVASKGLMGMAGDAAGSVLGFLGGPMGMMLMASIMPMALPSIMSAAKGIFGDIGGWLSGGSSKPLPIPRARRILTSITADAQQKGALKELHKYELYNKKTKKWMYNYNVDPEEAAAERKAYQNALKWGAISRTFSKDQYGAFRTSSSEIPHLIQDVKLTKNLVMGLHGKWDKNTLSYQVLGEQTAEALKGKLITQLRAEGLSTKGGLGQQVWKVLEGAITGKGKFGQLQQEQGSQVERIIDGLLKGRTAEDRQNIKQLIDEGLAPNSNLAKVLPGVYAKYTDGLSNDDGGGGYLRNESKNLKNLGFVGYMNSLKYFEQKNENAAKRFEKLAASPKTPYYLKKADEDAAKQAQDQAQKFTKMIEQLKENKKVELMPSSVGDIQNAFVAALTGNNQAMGTAVGNAITGNARSIAALVRNAGKSGTGGGVISGY